jgi:hypothetical protein
VGGVGKCDSKKRLANVSDRLTKGAGRGFMQRFILILAMMNLWMNWLGEKFAGIFDAISFVRFVKSSVF